MHIRIIFIGNNIPENYSGAPLLGLAKSIYYLILVSCEGKGCYRIVSLGHQNFDCQSYCGLSRRMQGNNYRIEVKKIFLEIVHQGLSCDFFSDFSVFRYFTARLKISDSDS